MRMGDLSFLNNMKLYQYTILKQDGSIEKLEPCKKKTFKELYKILNCQLIEIIPTAYYEDKKHGRCKMYGDEEARLLETNHRNPHFNVLLGQVRIGELREWDVVGDIVKEQKI